PLFGPTRWAIRTYPVVTSVLAPAVAFALARGLGLRVMSSLAVGALMAVLPWAQFYGRISFGGEMTFHQLLVLAAVARLVWGHGGWPEALMGALGLCLLLYDYSAGIAMMAMPVIGAVLARGRRRVWCLAILILALA